MRWFGKSARSARTSWSSRSAAFASGAAAGGSGDARAWADNRVAALLRAAERVRAATRRDRHGSGGGRGEVLQLGVDRAGARVDERDLGDGAAGVAQQQRLAARVWMQ